MRLTPFLFALAARILLLVLFSDVGEPAFEDVEVRSKGCEPPPTAVDGLDDVGVEDPVPASSVLPLNALNKLEARVAAAAIEAPVAAVLVLLSHELEDDDADPAVEEELRLGAIPSSVSLGVSSGVPSSPFTMSSSASKMLATSSASSVLR